MALGLTMIAPMLVDIADGRGHWHVFAESAILTVLCLGQLSALVWPRYRCSSSRAVHKTLGWCAICIAAAAAAAAAIGWDVPPA